MLDRFIQRYGGSAGVPLLIAAALLWGGEYVVAKDVLDILDPNWSNAIRMFFTSVMAIIIWRKKFREASIRDWLHGAASGICFGFAFALQIMGLKLINTGVNAFLSAAYVIMVPFMVWIMDKERPEGKVFVSALIGIVGVGAMSVTGLAGGHISVGPGEILSLSSAVGYGLAIVFTDKYTEETSVEVITGCQFFCTFIIAVVFALILEQPSGVPITVPVLAEFVYLIFFGTFATQLLFTVGMKYATSNQAGVIFPLESVTAAALGCIFLHEQLKALQVIGGLLVIAAIIISSVSFKKDEKDVKV